MRAALYRSIKSFAHDESGQAITEYILLLALGLLGAAGISKMILKSIDSFTNALGAQLEKDLKTGRYQSNDIWSN